MGLFNRVHAEMECPRCGREVDVVIETKGLGNVAYMVDLNVGDPYPWVPGHTPDDGGRPPGGNGIGDGYTDCPACGLDFFVDVVVEGDLITGVRVDPSRQGYIATGAA